MSASLDNRQRAMLAEMGVRVWSPQALVPQPAPADMETTVTRSDAPPAFMRATTTERAAPSIPRVTPPPVVTALPTAPMALSPLPDGLARMDWASLQAAAANCQACGLCQGRHHSFFASGSAAAGANADWLIVGDAPTDTEDLAGEAFVGEEGVLLDAMLQAMGLSRRTTGTAAEQVVITSAVKCHPQDKRNPTAEEIAHCNAYLQRQIELVNPKVILALGRFAAQALLQTSLGEAASQPLGKLRGQVHQVMGRAVVVSYHPAYLLRTPSDKAKAWADLILAMQQVRPIGA